MSSLHVLPFRPQAASALARRPVRRRPLPPVPPAPSYYEVVSPVYGLHSQWSDRRVAFSEARALRRLYGGAWWVIPGGTGGPPCLHSPNLADGVFDPGA